MALVFRLIDITGSDVVISDAMASSVSQLLCRIGDQGNS
jgi:hypothetical protein